jgi:hypothetical protein
MYLVMNEKEERIVLQEDKANTRGKGLNFSICFSLSNLKRRVFKFVGSF